MIYVRFHLYIQRMSRSMIKQQNSGATAHVVLYTPRQSTDIILTVRLYYYITHSLPSTPFFLATVYTCTFIVIISSITCMPPLFFVFISLSSSSGSRLHYVGCRFLTNNNNTNTSYTAQLLIVRNAHTCSCMTCCCVRTYILSFTKFKSSRFMVEYDNPSVTSIAHAL